MRVARVLVVWAGGTLLAVRGAQALGLPIHTTGATGAPIEPQGAPPTEEKPEPQAPDSKLVLARAEVRAKLHAEGSPAWDDTSDAGRAALVARLLREASSEGVEPLWSEACMWEALEVASEPAAPKLLAEVLSEMRGLAHVNVDQLRMDALVRWLAGPDARSKDVHRAVLDCVAERIWIEDTRAAEDLVLRLRPLLLTMDESERERFAALQDGIRSVESASAARAQLARETSDPDALFRLGTYLAFERGANAAGLALAERGRDRALAQLIAREREAALRIDDALQVADRWFSWGATQPRGPRRHFARARAIDWYLLARLVASPKQLAHIDGRIDKASESLAELRPVWSFAAPPPRRPDPRRALPQTRGMVDRAVRFLAAHQESDGRWSSHGFAHRCDPSAPSACGGPGQEGRDVGVTALALVALLSSGADEAKAPVARGLRWLMERADPQNGSVADAGHDSGYSLALATIALARAVQVGWVELAVVEARLSACTDRILAARFPYSAWGYPKSGTPYLDTSTTTWMVLALAESARTRTVAAESWLRGPQRGAWELYAELQERSTGVVGYAHKGGTASRTVLNQKFQEIHRHSMTASALLGTSLGIRMLRQEPEDFSVDRALAVLATGIPGTTEAEPYRDLYARYMAIAALHESGTRGRALFGPWYLAVVQELEWAEERLDCARGSWQPDGPWGHAGGRIYATAMAMLILTVPWQSDAAGVPSAAR